MGGSRPSWSAYISVEVRLFFQFFCSGVLLGLVELVLSSLLDRGDIFVFFRGDPSPRPVSNAPISSSFCSSSAFITPAWSATFWALPFSNSLSSRMMLPRNERFSDSNLEVSFSRFRILNDWVEFTRAISRFCRMNLRFTGTLDQCCFLDAFSFATYETPNSPSTELAHSVAPYAQGRLSRAILRVGLIRRSVVVRYMKQLRRAKQIFKSVAGGGLFVFWRRIGIGK